ncbi:MAG: diguanylate cyclase, partial [Pirellulaceae bacterium]|nr:diguanylate cyclase [Pirellulaceae bacterium]
MAIIFLLFALTNLGLGFACAYALTEPAPWRNWELPLPRRMRWGFFVRRTTRGTTSVEAASENPLAPPSFAANQDPPSEVSVITQPPPAESTIEPAVSRTSPPEAPTFSPDDLPREWLEALSAEGIAPNSLVEASAQVMRLEVGRYREQLITAENRARAHVAAADADSLEQVARDLVFINEDWLQQQTRAAKTLGQRDGGQGIYASAAEQLEETMLDQAAAIRSTVAALTSLDFQVEIETGGKRFLEKLAALIDLAHALRDRIGDLVAALFRVEKRLGAVGPAMQLDRATGLANRVGLELMFEQWRGDDPESQRQVAVALFDIDRFAQVNERLGTRAGDRTIAAFSRLLASLPRQDRGYDRVARIGGQTLLLFIGDAGPHNALTTAERMRQSLEATSWSQAGAEFDLSASAGVVEIRREDTLETVLD